MHYYLVHKKSGRRVYCFDKTALYDWVVTHKFCLSRKVCASWSVHRAIVNRNRSFGSIDLSVGPELCSLYTFIVERGWLFDSL